MVASRPLPEEIFEWLRAVPDPEIPVLSILDLGIVRHVEWAKDDALVVTITPTYSGCPAMDMISEQIHAVLAEHGVTTVRLHQQLSPAWTTDWIPDAARERLREYGIAPPDALVQIGDAVSKALSIPCPRCGSTATQVVSQYGSTACKALYKFLTCLEPFDAFKRH